VDPGKHGGEYLLYSEYPEMNIFIPHSLEAQAEVRELSMSTKMMLSSQNSKPVVVIVQDSLLGAYLMTKNVTPISYADLCQYLMRTNVFEYYDIHERLKYIQTKRNETIITTPAIFGFLLPADLSIKYDSLTIENGVVTKGYFSKASLGGTKKSLIRILCLEYPEKVAKDFINNIQFVTNAWLEINSFSVGIEDCLIDPEKEKEIKNIVFKSYMEAEQMISTTDNPHIREARINCSLNKAKDVGLRLAKETLKPDNNFISTVTAGSKGDYFNIAQIMGLLGQQNIEGRRPMPMIDNNKRTLMHYPRIIADLNRKYESRGFVSSSFIAGLNPKEMFFHAMSGREGMINTSQKTATSGYIQRRTIKINEDLKIAYDGTVRDAGQNIYQFAFGNHGFDPSRIVINDKGLFPCDIQRLAQKLNLQNEDQPRYPLTENDIDEIITKAIVPPPIPQILAIEMAQKKIHSLKTVLQEVQLNKISLTEFKKTIINAYHTAQIAPGDCVGIVGAQSIGEKQTQMTLNTFHTAGKLQQTGVDRFQELLNTTKNPKIKTCTLYFKQKYTTAAELREAIGSTLVSLTLDKLTEKPVFECEDETYLFFRYYMDLKTMFKYKVTPITICNAIQEFEDCLCIPEAFSLVIGLEKLSGTKKDEPDYVKTTLTMLGETQVCGIQGINEMYLNYANDEWFVVTDGSNLLKLLAHPLIDKKRIYCNDIWEVYDCLGITEVRKMLFQDIKENVEGVNDFHISLLVDKMTFKGRPTPITRYSMRTNDVGPLSKATFEESIDTIIAASLRTEKDSNAGISASIISGNRPKIGTGYMGLGINTEMLKLEENMSLRDMDPDIDDYELDAYMDEVGGDAISEDEDEDEIFTGF
jgi:DNA-directed RNA polymerase beta' subunit